MRTVQLPGTDIVSPVLGFGCSSLLGPKSRADGLALLQAAYDAGIRHFDVARSYGYGDAEGLLGEFLQGRRHEVTVTTKFGLQPMKSVARLRTLVGVGRRLMRLSPMLRRALGARARSLVKSGAFGVDEAHSSLETSLRELKTDRIDIYLLHQCSPEDCLSPGLLEFLEGAVREGKIGRFGIGTDIESTVTIGRSYPAFARVVQFENSVLERNSERLEPDPGRAVITHRALAGSYQRLRDALAADGALAGRWSRELGVDCSAPAVLGGLMLNYAVQANPRGLVLFSSTNPRTIRENVRSVSESSYSAEQLRRFAELVDEMPRAEK